MKNIVIIGGGTGTSTLLSGLRKLPVNNSVIVSTADDGGSGGRLRKELGIIPPGDFRQCLLGLSEASPEVKNIFGYRFDQGELAGHVVGNLIIASLTKMYGPEKALQIAGELLSAHGNIIPVTLFPTVLSATLENGKRIVGEHVIDEPRHNGTIRISRISLSPSQPVNPKALAAIVQADLIVFGPGDLYTSIIPNLLVKGVSEAVKKSKAVKVLVTNIMTKHGQTNGFKVSDFMTAMRKHVPVDVVLANSKRPTPSQTARYKKEKSVFVEPDVAGLKKLGVRALVMPLLSNNTFTKTKGDSLKRSFVRHDGKKLAKILVNLIK